MDIGGKRQLCVFSSHPYAMQVSTEQLFTAARTQNGYLPIAVGDEQLRALYELLKWGPTSANCCPARFQFVRSEAARERLAACVAPGNVAKVRQAPVTAIIGMDMAFYDKLPQLFPHVDARSWFVGHEHKINETAMRNSSLQGGYFIIAARALGLGCGPMSGFDHAKIDAAFWAGTSVKTNFICALGHGDPAKVLQRNPRLSFDEACTLV
jgi:3-hydroxypropanoate dehydrogenase